MGTTLTLEVIGPEAASLGGSRRHVFSSGGGVIGRLKTSDWVLAHTKVSGRHAVITCQDGIFYIEDTSTNGVFLNSPRNRLVSGRRYALEPGDHLFIEPYEISTEVSSEVGGGADDPFGSRTDGGPRGTPRPIIEDPFSAEPVAPPPRRTPMSREGRSLEPEPVATEELDPLKLLGGEEPRRSPARKVPTAEELDRRPAMSGHYQPPERVVPPRTTPPAPFEIPPDYDPLRDDFGETEPTDTDPPTPVADALPRVEPPIQRIDAEFDDVQPPSPPPPVQSQRTLPPPPVTDEGGSAVLVRALFEGAGLLEEVPATPDLARSFGRIFRIVVSGVMDVLRSRQDIRSEFRMRMTQFRPADNNPLKFSANVDDALHNLLVKRNPAFLQPVDAFEDAFADLRSHQLAMLAGMRVAFESMLAQFDPDRLEKDFDRQLKRMPILRAIKRLRYWDLYRDRRDDMARDPEESFKKLFGEEFARAYEEQLERLKAEARAPGPSGGQPRGSRA